MAYPCTSRRLSMETQMKELNLVFSEKNKLQILGISILVPVLGISSMWESQNDMFQQMLFQTKILFFGRGETRIMEKETILKNLKKIQLLTFIVKFFNRSINFQLFSTFWENRKKVPIFLKKFWRTICSSSYVANRIVLLGGGVFYWNPKFCRKKILFAVIK